MMFKLILLILEKLIFLVLVVGFLTLLERKLLGYLQIRKGPNKVSVMGILQPISDAFKLMFKEKFMGMFLNMLGFYVIPVLMLLITFMLWSLMGHNMNYIHMSFMVLFIIGLASLSAYMILGSGWLSTSKYTLLSCIRSVAQMISYEVSMVMVIFLPVVFMLKMDVYEYSLKMNFMFVLLIMSPLFLIWVISILAETNRAPFDFAEGESEIVSGYTTEYSSFEFASLIMSEYLMIFFYSLLTSVFFVFFESFLLSSLMLLFFTSMMILIRGSYPRLRYDLLMMISWKFSLMFVILFFYIMMFIL